MSFEEHGVVGFVGEGGGGESERESQVKHIVFLRQVGLGIAFVELSY